MFTNRSAHIRKFFLGFMLVGIVLSLLSAGGGLPTAHAQDVRTPQTTEQPSIRTLPLPDEPLIEEHVINGPPVPPPGFEAERQPVEVFASSAVTIAGVPAYTWTLGCSAGGGGITAAFLDSLYPNIFDGEMPLDDSSMPIFTDVNGDTYRLNPSVASQATFTDYWIEYGSPLPDPYTGCGLGCSVPAPRSVGDDLSSQSAGWLQHAWGDTLGDFMYTSQSAFGNVDGSTKFYTYENSASPFTWEEMSSNSKPDGALGMRLFYETRGYAVGESYNQLTDNVVTGGFSLAQYKAEINAGRPVILHLGSQPNEPGHTVVGIGYDTASNTVYIHDGWDYATHTMTWGGSYSGMPLQMVSIVNIVPGTPSSYTISGNVGAANATIAYTGGYTTSDTNGNYSFTVVSGWFGTVTPSKTGITFTPIDRFYANVESNVVAQNFNNINLLQDPGFEDGASTNNYWVGTSTNFGTPLCDVNCIGEVLARTGSIWVWFGGVEANETATLSQIITIPNTSSASLDFYLRIPDARAGSDIADAFTVKVDGTTVFTANATQVKYYSVYRPINVNISAYADGAQHEIEFSAVTTGQVVSFHLDDVSLTTTSSSSPPAAFNKTSPSNGAIGQSTSPTLSWGSSTDATSYEYCYDITNDNACSNWTNNSASTSKALSGLSASTTYYWHVRAVNGSSTTYSNDSATTFWSFTTASNPPGAFNKSSPANGATGQSTSPTLSWNSSSGATSYEYCYDTTNDNACSSWTSNGASTSKTLSGLSAGTTHYWHIRAVNGGGATYANGSPTAYWSFTTASNPPGAFNKSTPTNGATNQSTGPTLSWASSTGTTSYEYCYDTINDNSCSTWTSNGTSTSKALSGLSASTIYYWHVRAKNSSGTTYANGNNATAYWSFTTAASSPIQAIDVWSADENWNPKTSFVRNDPIKLVITVENTTGGNAQVTLVYVVKNPSGVVIENWQETISVEAGTWYWGLPRTIPNVVGIYTFTGSVVYQGVTTTRSMTYVVNLPSYSISGNAGVAGATLNYTDGTSKTVTANGSGDYSIVVPSGWNGIVTPYKSGYTFTPVSRSYNNLQSDQTAQDYTAQVCASCADVNVTIGGDSQGDYTLANGEERRLSFNVSGGPVKVESSDPSKKIVTAIRLQSYVNNTLYSFAETMGVPSGLLSYKYYFPSYNNIWAPLNSQIRFSNLDANPTTIRVTIGGDNVWEQQVLGGEEKRLSFDVSGGPVIIESLDPAKKIAAAIRLQSYANNTLYSFAETMGIPAEQVSNTYYFPSYNNIWAPLNSQLRIGNLNASDVTVRVTIGGDIVWEDVVPGLDEKRLSFNVSGGPVKVESLDPDPSKKIVTAIRLQSYANNTLYSFAETMGVPSGLLSYKYYFPSYNNIWAPLNSQIRFSNLDANPTTIRVTIGGNNVWEQQVLGGEEKRLSFDVSGGPVIIESLDPAKKIAAAIRLQSYADNTLYSFAETMGIPAEWMSNTYYFPSYNNIWAPLNSQLRFGLP